MKQFKLVHDNGDVVAYGAVLPSKQTVLEWTSAIKSLHFYDNVDMLNITSCQEGKNVKLKYLDENSSEKLREYYFQRNEDVSGMSGTGIVVRGVEMPSGKAVQEWVSGHVQSINIYPNIKAAEFIHSHEGRTVMKFIDEEDKKQ